MYIIEVTLPKHYACPDASCRRESDFLYFACFAKTFHQLFCYFGGSCRYITSSPGENLVESQVQNIIAETS